MEVTKRNGKKEKVNLNKITERINKLIKQAPELKIDPVVIAAKVIQGLYDGISTRELDKLASEICGTMASHHFDYDTLASRLVVSNLHKETSDNFVEKTQQLYEMGALNDTYYGDVNKIADWLLSVIDYNRDYYFDYFGVSTLKRAYLIKDKKGSYIERPQDMWMRVSVAIHGTDKEKILETYNLLSNKYFIHATPTLFNSGTIRPQLSSCFLLDMADDSIEGIYKSLSDCAKISQSAGGIGLSIHRVRSSGSYIKGTNGNSNGIVPMLRVFDATARYVDQGGGKRKGSIAIYIEPWHADILEFLDLKKNHGKEELRARDLFYALWIPDLFMERVEKDEEWSLFDPAEAFTIIDNKKIYLYDTYGDEFELLYKQLELQGKSKKVFKARELWEKILNNQIETGVPYILYKDAANEKSNQKNLGTIKSSNLCTEIIEYTDENEVAVCNLGSISLPAFLDYNGDNISVDFDNLYRVSRTLTRNLNKVIDVNHYPVKEAKYSNLKHRPIGIGVQGLADLYAKLKIPFTSEAAKEINKKIFETIYKGSVDESIDLAKKMGTYETYKGSPASKGILQFDMWGVDRNKLFYDWSETFKNLDKYGLRNSLLLAPMPTASTSQILGNNECFEPYTSNLYTRRTLAGEFIVANRHLVKDLQDLGLWDEKMRQALMRNNGSVQGLGLPLWITEVYKTVWEMSMRDIIDMSADRGPFICQSQSLNLFVREPSLAKLTSMHFYSWKKGLKTGMYYLRTEAARDAIKFTVENEKNNSRQESEVEEVITGDTCSIDDPNCESCSG